MASKWSEMTDEEKKERMEKSKEYRYKRKAKDLGISLEEYKSRLKARAEGKQVKLRSGKRKINTTYRAELQNILDCDYKIKKRGLKRNAGQIEQGVKVSRGDGSITVLFRKADVIFASFHKEPLNDGSEKGHKAPLFFVDMTSGKMRRYDPETDAKSTKIKEVTDLKWPKAV